MLETLGPARRRVDGWASSLRFAGVYVAPPLPARCDRRTDHRRRVRRRSGERVIAVVTQSEGPDGRVVLSLRRVRNRKQWAQTAEIRKAGRVIDTRVLEANRGGVVVVGVDRDRQRISPSIKRLCADSWEAHVGQLETGQTVDATVTRVMPFGAFAHVADGVEGLIHVTELAGERIGDPAFVCSPR